MVTRVQRWGNSLGLRIPKSFAAEVRIAPGSMVKLSVKDGDLVVSAIANKTYVLDDLLAAVTRANRHAEIVTGGPVGREVW